ncbi:MAG TPA: acylphosphatase [Candidatus Xenobia bacterium]
MSDDRFHATVAGQVQGVGFRHFVWQRGQHLGLRGWVRNMPDGRVEAMVQGPRASLDIMEAYLRRGPASARVDHFEVEYLPADDVLGIFDIRY